MIRFTLSQIPMPPSQNKQYAAMAVRGGEGRWFGKIRPTKELETYKKIFEAWALQNNIAIAKARKFIRDEILMKGLMIGVDTFLCFRGTSLWTQKNEVKTMDGSNRIKALHDCLADSLQVNDSYFWDSGRALKLETTRPEPWCFVEIFPCKPMSVSEWQESRKQDDRNR